MKKTYLISITLLTILTFSFTSCLKDLDRKPFYGLNTESVYEDAANYKHVLAKLYAGLAMTGNTGPAGSSDLTVSDEGKAQYLRAVWNLQELTTDEAVCAWTDADLNNLHHMDWDANQVFIGFCYNRIYYQIPLCNEFIRQSADSKLSDRGFSDAEKSEITAFKAEARFLRAFSYYNALDLFGNVPFVTEDDEIGANIPERITRADLFAYVESELKDIENTLPEPHTNEYGRADKAAGWTLLAKLYLNAQVYVGQSKYAECITYCNKVINAGFTLEPIYQNLFLADNHLSDEIIFPICFDGQRTKTYGGTTFLTHCGVGGTMPVNDFGIGSGWAGYRTTPSIVNLHTDSSLDGRYLFYKSGQTLNITSEASFTDGYALTKFKNVTSTGAVGSDPKDFADTDFPLFRLADVYLMYAEAALRGGGDVGTALSYVNELRERAYGNTSGNVTSIDLDFILNERAKELCWEGQRRTDLIRYGKFAGGGYVWQWKGNDMNGVDVSEFRNLFPIPSSDLTANPNLVQNPGY